MHWTFRVIGACSAAVLRNDLPSPVPALVSTGVTTTHNPVPTLGLDGDEPDGTAGRAGGGGAGRPADGIVVDRTLALRAAYFQNIGFVTEQVWTAPGALRAIRAKLVAAGVVIDSVATIGQARGAAGPAGAGAGQRAVRRHRRGGRAAGRGGRGARPVPVGTPSAARVRGPDRRPGHQQVPARLRADRATGGARFRGADRDRRRAVASVAVLRDVPEFRSPPAAPPLLYSPPALLVGGPLLIALAVLAVAATAAALAVIRSARPELLRQAQP